MPNASDRFSIRKRVKCVHVEEPANLEAAERLFARLCVRMLWAERSRRPPDEAEPTHATEDE